MNTVLDHRTIHQLNIPQECNGFKIDDYVEYNKNGENKKGYIYCFRRFGYSWFAWIYFDKNIPDPIECVYIGELMRVEE